MPRNDSRVSLIIRLTEQERDKFKLYAVKNKTTMQDITLNLIKNYLNNSEEEKVSEYE